MNLKELIKRYNNIKPYTTATQLCNIKELVTLIGNKPIIKINDVIISKLIRTYQEKGNSNKTINDKLSILRGLLKYAYSIGKIQYIPLIPTQKVTDTRTKTLSRKELALMLSYCHQTKEKQLAYILLIGYYTGFRINNILSLTPDNYSVEDNILSIYDKKVNRFHTIPVSKKIKYIMMNLKQDNIYFNISYRQCYYLFTIMKQKLNLDETITIHTLRHTFCSNLVNKDVPISTIQRLANHKNINTTMRYTHTKDEQLIKAIDVL